VLSIIIKKVKKKLGRISNTQLPLMIAR